MLNKLVRFIQALEGDDIPAPTITTDPWPTTTTNTTTGGGFTPIPYTGGIEVSGWFTIFLFAGIFLVFAYIYYKRGIADELARLKARHFILDTFLSDTEATDLSDYNRKYGVVIFFGFVGMIGIPAVSISLIPIEFAFVRGIITIMGYGMMILFLWNFLDKMSHNEIKSMQNAVWFEVEFYIPGRGTFHKVWKKTEPIKEVVLSDTQYGELASRIIKNARDYGHKFKKGEAQKAKTDIIKRLKTLFIYRTSVKGRGDFSYQILLILKHPWNEVVNPNTEELFHRTTDVTVQRAPHHIVYIGESDRIFQDLSSKGSPEMRQLTMGVCISIVDRQDVGEILMDGRFDSPDAQDAIAAQMLSYYEQETTTAKFVNGKINALNKRDKEYEELEGQKDEESQAQFNTYLRVFNKLFTKHQQRGTVTNFFLYAVVFFFVYWALFSMLGWMG